MLIMSKSMAILNMFLIPLKVGCCEFISNASTCNNLIYTFQNLNLDEVSQMFITNNLTSTISQVAKLHLDLTKNLKTYHLSLSKTILIK